VFPALRKPLYIGRAVRIRKDGKIGIAVCDRDPPPLNSKILNERLEEIGVVVDVFGPVNEPYIRIRLTETGRERFTPNGRLYTLLE